MYRFILPIVSGLRLLSVDDNTVFPRPAVSLQAVCLSERSRHVHSCTQRSAHFSPERKRSESANGATLGSIVLENGRAR